MAARLTPKIRLLLVLLLLTAFGGVVALFAMGGDPAPTVDHVSAEESVSEELSEPKIHPKSPATDFYETPLVADPPLLKEVRFTPDQVSRESILFLLILNEGDLLADYCLLTAREFIDERQLDEARAIARQYDDRLKDLRRERSQILEQAGISIEDPSQRLAKFREKAFRLYCEVNQKILAEVLTAEQRKQVFEKSQELRAAREAAAAKSDNASAAYNGNQTN